MFAIAADEAPSGYLLLAALALVVDRPAVDLYASRG
jgi:hypothetical protein